MWVVHFTDKNGKATVSVCQSRDAALKSARGLRQHRCVVHYISGPNGARIELKDILVVLAAGAKHGLEVSPCCAGCAQPAVDEPRRGGTDGEPLAAGRWSPSPGV